MPWCDLVVGRYCSRTEDETTDGGAVSTLAPDPEAASASGAGADISGPPLGLGCAAPGVASDTVNPGAGVEDPALDARSPGNNAVWKIVSDPEVDALPVAGNWTCGSQF